MLSLRSLRLALRALSRAPVFALAAVITLALGIAASSAIFSVINGSQLALLPWGDTETIASIDVHKPKGDQELRDASHGQFRDLQREARAYSGLAAIQSERAYLTDRDEPLMVFAPRVTANAFDVVGVRPLIGRAFEARDGVAGAEPVAMMSERMWMERYGGAEDIVGGAIEIDGQRTTVIGIIANARWFPSPSVEIVRPLIFGSEAPPRDEERLGIVGRLAPGATVARAQAELDTLTARFAERYPATDTNLRLGVQLTRDAAVGARSKASNVVLFGAVGFLLLIVCANLAGLMLARAAGREKELATRAAVGASRAQIAVELIAECVVIGLLAFPLSVAATRLCLDYLLSLVPDTVTYMDQILRLDTRVVAFAAAATLVTVLLFGVSPALRASRVDLNESLKGGGQRGSTGSQRTRSILVVAQIALAVSLLTTTVLFTRAVAKVRNVNPGFEVANAIVASVDLPDARYGSPEALRAFQQKLLESLGRPSDAQIALASRAPLGGNEGPWRVFQIQGRETAGGEEPPRARADAVSPELFSTLGLKALAGRMLTTQDGADAQRVVVVSKTFADKYFPGQSAVGRLIELQRGSGANAASYGTREIIGVVSDVKALTGRGPPADEPRIYEPLAQQPTAEVAVIARVQPGTDQAVSEMLRRRVREIDPLIGVARIETMEVRFERLLWQSVFFVRILAILGALAMILAAIGVYGVVSYTTERRTREFGIRAALGAEPAAIARLVLRSTLRLAGWGLGLGLGLALLWGKASERLFYDPPEQDPLTFAAVLGVVLIVMVGASTLPMLRAIRLQPADCLRVD